MNRQARNVFSGLLSIAALGLLSGVAAAQDAFETPKKVTSIEGITEYRLPNGLRVLLFPDPTRPKVTVNLTVLVGSRHEGYGETGMAHLLEHMLFKGTPTHPNIPGAMKERGAQFNGSTWLDRTNYYETLPASDQNLEFAIRLEADRMINSPIKAEDLATEFSVVRNEFEMGENSPESVLSQRMMAVAYEWHNYGKSTIGNRSDIERVPVDNLRAFYKKFYQPDNAMLVVAGAFDEKKALEYITKYFGSLPRPDRKLQETYTEEPPQDGERVVTLRRVGDVGLVGLLYHVPAASHAEFPAVELLGDILDSEPSGRLYKALVESKKATSVSVRPTAGHDPGAIEIIAEVNTKDLAALEKVRDVMISVVDEIARSGRHPARSGSGPPEGPQKPRAGRHRSQPHRHRAQRMGRTGRLAALFPQPRPDRTGNAGAGQGGRREILRRQQPDRRLLRADGQTRADRRSRPRPTSPRCSTVTPAGKSRPARARRPTSRPWPSRPGSQRPEPIAGVKLAFLPKKTRGESVQLRLTLHYGNAENLKGLDDASGFLRRPDDREAPRT